MKNVLVTGGAGYIGNVLVPILLNDYHHVTVLDNLVHRQHGIVDNCWRHGFNFVLGDVRDYELYGKLIAQHDVIINLAAYVGMPLCKRWPNEAKEVNQASSEFLAKTVSKDQLVIFATTNSGYGLGEHVDGKAIYCTEETPLRPISVYGETKCAAEKAIMETGNNISFRLATVMGVSRKMRMDLLVNDFTYRAWNDRFIVLFESHFLRNFIHVRDVTNAMRWAVNGLLKQGEVYNLGNTSANVNKRQLCEAIKKQVPDFYITESEYNKDPDQRNYIVSNEKLEKTGWMPSFSLDDSIAEVLRACPIIKHSNCPFSDV